MTAPVTNPERLPARISPAKIIKFDEVEKMSKAISPQLFGMKNSQEVCTLMMLGVADGIHPITALRRYHIIEGKPSMRAEAMLGCFKEAGGKVKWITRTDQAVKAEFSFRDESVTIEWTIARARTAGVAGKKNWTSYPCQMLTARVISEGVRIVMPQIVTGIYTPEEVMDFDKPGVPSKPQIKEEEVVDVKPVIDVQEKIQQLTGWIQNILDPEHFERNAETDSFKNYRQQITTDGEGLPEEELLKLREMAYGKWLACMITTATDKEIQDDTWSKAIGASKLSGETQLKLAELLRSRKTPEQPTGPAWIHTWKARIEAADKFGPAVSTFNDLVTDYTSSAEPDQAEHFPGLFLFWLNHCLKVGGGRKDPIAKKISGNHGLSKAIVEQLTQGLADKPRYEENS